MMGIIGFLFLMGLFSGRFQVNGTKENLARKAAVSQSSTVAPRWAAALAVDGGKDFSTLSATCAATNWEDVPWFKVDLQTVYRVNIAIVTYREDSFPDISRQFVVNVGSSLQLGGYFNPRCSVTTSDETTSTVTYSCGGQQGRYLIIWASWEILSVCEVEVYEKDELPTPTVYSFRLSFMKIWFNSTVNLSNPTVTDNVLKELTSALAVRGITNVTLSWTKTPEEEVEEEVIQTQPEYNVC